MTHITISDRIIAVEVQKDSTYHTISEMNGVIFLSYIVPPKYPEWETPILPPDKTYKFLCLASEIVLAHHAIKLTVDEIVDSCDKLDKDKEYALIEVM